MTVSGKVTAATTAAAAATVVTNTVAAHLFHGVMPSDVQGLIQATVTAAITFGAGWFARCGLAHKVDAVAAEVAPIVKAAEPVAEKVAESFAPSTAVEDVKDVATVATSAVEALAAPGG